MPAMPMAESRRRWWWGSADEERDDCVALSAMPE